MFVSQLDVSQKASGHFFPLPSWALSDTYSMYLDVSIHPSLLWDACHQYDSYHGYSTFRDETGAKSMEPDQRGVGTWMKRCATSLRESSTSALRPSLSWIPRDIGPGALPHLSGVCFMSRQACCSIMKQNLAYSSRDFKT